MSNKLKRILSMISAAAVTTVSLSAAAPASSAVEEGEVIFTAECETLEGVDTVWTSIYENQTPGYSGDGFAYLTGSSFKATVEAPEEGMYDISVRYVQILDSTSRYQTISVNGVEYSTYFPYAAEWTDISFGTVRLKEGENTIEFLNKYGYAGFDTMTVSKAAGKDYTTAADTPCDPDATPETKALMKYLKSVYGDHIISGQQEVYGGGSSLHQETISLNYDAAANTLTDSAGNAYTFEDTEIDTADDGSKFVWNCYSPEGKKYTYDTQNRNYKHTNYDYEFEYLYDLSGEYPAIRGFDIMNSNPLYGWEDGTTERVIDWVNNRGGIATMCWHFNVPTDFSTYELGETLDWQSCTYSNKTNFSVANAVTEGTAENDFLNLCIEDVAEQLLIIQEAGVPVMWRPFHEAEGNGGLDGAGAWFWWAKEGAETYKTLWKYLYDKLTNDYGLHNLIWVQNLYAWSDESAQWYPGDDYVDIVGYDKYNTQYNRHDGLTSGPNEDAELRLFNSLYDHVDGKKIVAMPENDTVPSLKNLQIEGAGWLYFCIWYDNGQQNFVSGTDYQNPDTLKELYQSDYCITLDELPENLYEYDGTTTPTEPDETTAPDEESTTEPVTADPDIMYGDVNGTGEVEVADAILIMSNVINAELYPLTAEQTERADVYQKGDGIGVNDAVSIQKYITKLISELPESYM